MNYIKQILAFYDKQMLNPLSTGEIALWHALMHINNKTGWSEWFTVANLSLQSLSGLSRSGINKDRNVLKQNGFIDFKTKGTKATSYRVISLVMQDSNQVSTQDSVQGSNQDSNQNSDQDSVQNSSALIKQNKTKQNKKKNNKKSVSSSKIKNDFEELWKQYPRKQGKVPALKAYTKAINAGITYNRVLKGITAYKKQIAAKHTEQRFIKQGSTWFSQHGWEDDYDFTPDYGSNKNVKETLPDWAKDDYQEKQKVNVTNLPFDSESEVPF